MTSLTGGFTSTFTPTPARRRAGWERGGSVGAPANAEEEDLASTEAAASLPADVAADVAAAPTPTEDASAPTEERPPRPPLRVLFLSADTGGGHRASAESLAKQFVRHYPGSTYDLVDVWSKDGCLPYRLLVPAYKFLSAHPRQWRVLYHGSNTFLNLWYTDTHSMITCERKIRRTIASYDPDVVVSVHPTTQNVPLKAVERIGRALGKRTPFFTVVTDLGSGHCHWFHPGVDRTYVASDRIRRLARRRGRVPADRLSLVGLPIRPEFADRAADVGGDRTSAEGRAVAERTRRRLGLDPDRRVVLVMGGGEGVGALRDIVEATHAAFVETGVDATIAVVCGRNDQLRTDLATRDWTRVTRTAKRSLLARSLGRGRVVRTLVDPTAPPRRRGRVDVLGLGFVTNMADYMVASDVLVTKAGPGTIAEAAAVGLPVMLTSFLPGQEAGNVDVVLDGGFGEYREDPEHIAEGVAAWLRDDDLLGRMSRAATAAGAPDAASEIVLDIGRRTEEALRENASRASPN